MMAVVFFPVVNQWVCSLEQPAEGASASRFGHAVQERLLGCFFARCDPVVDSGEHGVSSRILEVDGFPCFRPKLAVMPDPLVLEE